MPRLLLIFALLLPACAATAAPLTGTELLNRCAAYEKSTEGGDLSAAEGLDAMWCMGYVSGLLDGFGVADFRIGGAKAVCVPEQGYTRTEAVKTITRWLRDNPGEQSKSGRRSAIVALTKVLPCPRE